MKRACRRKYEWNLLGKHCGLNIFRRLDHINGKPMVVVGVINFILWWMNCELKNGGVNSSEVLELTSTLGWCIFCAIMRVAFWILLADGVISNFLEGLKRGCFFSFAWRVTNYGFKRAIEGMKEDLDWICFIHRNPEFYNEFMNVTHAFTVKHIETGICDRESLYNAHSAVWEKHGIRRDAKGRLYTLKDKEARDKKRCEKAIKENVRKERAMQVKIKREKAKRERYLKSRKYRKMLEEL